MRLIDLLLAETRTPMRRLAVLATVSAGSNAALLAIVNRSAEHIKDGQPQIMNLLLFLAFIMLYGYSQRTVMHTTSGEVEQLVHRCRERLVELLRRCELRELDQIGRGRIFSAISSDTQTVSQTASALVMGIQAAILIACACAYLATISLTSLVVSAVFLTITARIYLYRMRGVNGTLHEAYEQENQMHDLVSGMLDGFKEVKLSSLRAGQVITDLVHVSTRTAELRTAAQHELGANFIFAQVAFMLLLGTLVFVTPMLGTVYAGSVMESMTTVIFLFGPISALVATIPQVAVANAAAENLHNLEQLLTTQSASEPVAPGPVVAAPAPAPVVLRTLELRRVFFSHLGTDRRFEVGPINLTISAGETLFITGGNGSGKSTLIRLLTGLYPPLSGELLVNGVPVNAGSAQAYRDRFCAVFSDFHLFRKLYGVAAPLAEQADDWLREMEMADKARIVDQRFSTIDLSTGQKKRLALISAMLEDKPIVVLDEWAADQDPHFRRKFYDELLPRMKAAGKTVIAVTHDERYFHVADRRMHMEDGQLHELTETAGNE